MYCPLRAKHADASLTWTAGSAYVITDVLGNPIDRAVIQYQKRVEHARTYERRNDRN